MANNLSPFSLIESTRTHYLENYYSSKSYSSKRLNVLLYTVLLFKSKQLYSPKEMDRRLSRIRSHMEQEGMDACVFTSYHNIYYFSDFLYCSMGRQYGLIVTDEKAVTITPCKYVTIFTLILVGWEWEMSAIRTIGSVVVITFAASTWCKTTYLSRVTPHTVPIALYNTVNISISAGCYVVLLVPVVFVE